MHEANSALLEILVDISVILLFFTSYIAGILKVQCKLAVKVNAANLECNFVLNCQTVGRVWKCYRKSTLCTKSSVVDSVGIFDSVCFIPLKAIYGIKGIALMIRASTCSIMIV